MPTHRSRDGDEKTPLYTSRRPSAGALVSILPRGRLAGRVGVLGERNFRLFFAGYTTSLIGTFMVPVALTFAVLAQGGTTPDVGYVLAAETVPLALIHR